MSAGKNDLCAPQTEAHDLLNQDIYLFNHFYGIIKIGPVGRIL